MEYTNKTVPFADEAVMAQLAYSRWEQETAESMAEYVYRRRTIDLAALLGEAIEQELNENQRRLIHLRYYDKLTPVEIARRTGLHLSSVTRSLQTAQEKLQRVLRYVVEYRESQKQVTALPLAVRQAMAVSAARHRVTHTLPERLAALREKEMLRPDVLAGCVQMTPERYADIECGACLPDAEELLRLAAFFDISVDVLLKGDAA